MVLAVKLGVVNCAPVNTGVLPVAVVYQLKVTPGWVDVEVNTADEPAQVCVGFCDTIGTKGVDVTFAVT